MVNYTYIVLPCSGSPYKVHQRDQDETAFLQKEVVGHFEEIKNPLLLHPDFEEGWSWVKNLLSSKVKYQVFANVEGRIICSPNQALFINSYYGVVPLFGNAVIKMTQKNFEKIKGKVWNTFDEMVKYYEDDEESEDDTN